MIIFIGCTIFGVILGLMTGNGYTILVGTVAGMLIGTLIGGCVEDAYKKYGGPNGKKKLQDDVKKENAHDDYWGTIDSKK